MVWVSWFTRMAESMKESGLTIEDMEEAMRDFQMEIFIKDTISKVRHTGRVYITGSMERFTMESG